MTGRLMTGRKPRLRFRDFVFFDSFSAFISRNGSLSAIEEE